MILILYISTLAVIATVCFILGLHILLRDISSKVNRLFFINSMLLNTVIAFTIFIQLADDVETAKFFQSMYNIIFISFLLESLYFSLVFTQHRLNLIMKVIVSVATSAVFIFFIIKGGELIALTKQGGVWIYKLKNIRFWFFVYSPLLFIIVFFMISTLYRYSRAASSNKGKKQAKIMLIFILISCSAGFFFLMIMPLFDGFRAPLLTPCFFALYLYGVFFAMTKYRFMVFNIKDIVQDVLTQIQDMVIILGPDKRILEMNNSASAMFRSVSGGGKGSFFTDVVYEKEAMEAVLDLLLEKRIFMKERITYLSKPDASVTDSTISAVSDKFGDLSAILIISRENRGINYFRNYFKLTAREMEIILHTISGMTNNEIAAVLDITKRTVETHQNNIYNKLAISNKIELLNITGDFGIKPL